MQQDEIKAIEIPDKKYILLDWNVIKYIKAPRKNEKEYSDTYAINIINAMRSKYYFPFCESHLCDLLQSYNQCIDENIKSDLMFLEKLTQGTGLIPNETRCAKYSASKYFEEMTKLPKPDIQVPIHKMSTKKVNMESISLNNPLRPLLEQSNGTISTETFCPYLEKLYDDFFSNSKTYSNLRNEIDSLSLDSCNKQYAMPYEWRLLKYATPFFESRKIQTKEELLISWESIVNSWLCIESENTTITLFHKLLISYALLDVHPLFREKLKKKNKLDNIVRDSKLISYASKASFLITEDKQCYEKAKFIFKAHRLEVQTLKLEEFVKKFS